MGFNLRAAFQFLFMSIMFPTIFALAIRGLGENTKWGPPAWVMSIVGGFDHAHPDGLDGRSL